LITGHKRKRSKNEKNSKVGSERKREPQVSF